MTTTHYSPAVADRPAPEVVRISTGELERQLPPSTPATPSPLSDAQVPAPGAGVPAVLMDAPVLPALPSLDEISADLVPHQRGAVSDISEVGEVSQVREVLEVLDEPEVADVAPEPAVVVEPMPARMARAGGPRRLMVLLVLSASLAAGMLFAALLV